MAYKPDHSKLFGEAIKYLLAEKKLSQRLFAQKGGLDYGYVSKLVNGLIVQPRQEKFAQIAKGLGLTVADLRQIVDQYIKEHEEAILKGENSIDLNKDHPKVNNFPLSSVGPNTDIPGQEKKITILPKIDWGEAPETESFVGRAEELKNLQKLIADDHCRLIAILACGGTGKSALARELVEQNQAGFDFVIWRSLRDAPSLEKILLDCLQHICPEQSMRVNETIADKINFFFQYLQKSRCLIILDNFETLFVPQDRTGKYREGYKNYGDFIKRVGETLHQSCLLITSREKPSEVAILEGKAVQSQQIKGLQSKFAIEILEQRGLEGTPSEKQQLVKCYDNNPLALKIIAGLIIEVFNSKISPFLEKHISTICHSDIDDVLKEQYDRLTKTERELMYWLAINREFTPFDDLASYIFPSVLGNDLIQAICNLKRRSLVEMSGAGYTLQNVIMEYMTERLCQIVSQEIVSNCLDKFNRYAFLIARAKDYVRETQRRLIIQRIIELAEEKIGSRELLINHLNNLINVIRAKNLHGYAGGNLLDILIYLQVNLTGYDFSGLTIRQSFFRDVELYDVNLENAELHNCIFAEMIADILTIVFSEKTNIVAGSDAHGHVYVWQVDKRQKLLTLFGHKDLVISIKFSQDEKTLITASIDKTVRFWDIDTGNCKTILNIETEYSISSVRINPDCQILATSYFTQGNVDLWQLNTGEHLRTLSAHQTYVNRIAFSHDNQLIVTRDRDAHVILWSVHDGEILENITEISPSHFLDEGLAFNQNAKILITANKDFSIEFWDIRDLKNIVNLTTIPNAHANKVRCIVVSSDNKIMATGSADKTIKLWNITNSQNPRLLSVLAGHSSWITGVEFSPDRKTLITTSSDKTIRWWNIERPYKPNLIEQFRGCSNCLRGIVFSNNGKILVSGSDDQTIRLWDVETGKLLEKWLGHHERVMNIAFSPNGEILGSASWDYTVKLWHFKTGKCLATLADHGDQVYSIAFMPNQKYLVSVGDDHTVKVWNIHTQKLIDTWHPHIRQLYAVAVSPDGQKIAVAGYQGVIKLLDAHTGKIMQSYTGHQTSILGLAFSPHGENLASTGSDGTVSLWDIKTAEELKKFPGQEIWYYKIVFSPNGQFLAFGSYDNTVCIWDSKNDQCHYLSGHNDNVLTVAFRPDGHILASGSYDGVIKLWNIHTNECLATCQVPLPYAGMKIKGIKGLAKAEQQTLQGLGAVR